jgi:hypothetical protein
MTKAELHAQLAKMDRELEPLLGLIPLLLRAVVKNALQRQRTVLAELINRLPE